MLLLLDMDSIYFLQSYTDSENSQRTFSAGLFHIAYFMRIALWFLHPIYCTLLESGFMNSLVLSSFAFKDGSYSFSEGEKRKLISKYSQRSLFQNIRQSGLYSWISFRLLVPLYASLNLISVQFFLWSKIKRILICQEHRDEYGNLVSSVNRLLVVSSLSLDWNEQSLVGFQNKGIYLLGPSVCSLNQLRLPR